MALWKKSKVYRFTKSHATTNKSLIRLRVQLGLAKNWIALQCSWPTFIDLKLLFNCISIISNCIVIILICGAIIAQVVNHRNVNNAVACADTFCSLRCADLVLTEHQNFTIEEPDFGLLKQDNIFKLCSDKFDYSSTLHTSLNLFLPVILYITIQMHIHRHRQWQTMPAIRTKILHSVNI